MKRSMAKWLFMGFLFAALLLNACGTNPPEENDESENSHVSDRAQDLSAEESDDLQSEPQMSGADPTVVLPEERETVLELVTTFKTGEDGLFYIGSHHGGVFIPVDHRVDENGVLYTFDGESVTRTSDGKQVRGQHGWNTAACGCDLLVKEELLYILYSDGFVEVCSVDDESVYTLYDLSAVADLFKLEPDGNVRYTELGVSSDREVVVTAVSKAGKLRYRLDGTQIPLSASLSIENAGLPSVLYALEKGKLPPVMDVSGGVVCAVVVESHEHKNCLENGTKREAVYDFYDLATGDLSRVFIRQDWG